MRPNVVVPTLTMPPVPTVTHLPRVVFGGFRPYLDRAAGRLGIGRDRLGDAQRQPAVTALSGLIGQCYDQVPWRRQDSMRRCRELVEALQVAAVAATDMLGELEADTLARMPAPPEPAPPPESPPAAPIEADPADATAEAPAPLGSPEVAPAPDRGRPNRPNHRRS